MYCGFKWLHNELYHCDYVMYTCIGAALFYLLSTMQCKNNTLVLVQARIDILFLFRAMCEHHYNLM